MANKKREVRKTPFLIMIRKPEWNEGMYQLLPSVIFEKTLFASKAKMEVLAANGINLADTVKQTGTLRVCVVNFTETTDYEPDIGYRQQDKDPMEVIPLGDAGLSGNPPTGLGEPSSDVELEEDEATPPDEEDDTEDEEDSEAESDEPLVPVDDEGLTGEDVAPSLPLSRAAVEPEDPSDILSPQTEQSSEVGSTPLQEPVDPGSEITPTEGDEGFWAGLPGAEVVEPVTAESTTPPPPLPQGSGTKVSGDDVVI